MRAVNRLTSGAKLLNSCELTFDFSDGKKENIMRKQIYFLAIAIAVCAGSVANANAQTTQFTADIPFMFHVGNQSLPAGEYTVRCINPSSDMKILQLRSSNGESAVLVRTSSVIGRKNEDTKLVFNRYGNQYYFAQAWLVSENIGMQAVKSRQERATAKEMARLAYKPEMVALTANR